MNRNCGDLSKYLLIGPTPYQSNLNTGKPWIFGAQTVDDVVKDYTDRIKTYDNVTNCGDAAPFWDGAKCISCSDPTPIFNLATSTCDVCPKGTVYDTTADMTIFDTDAHVCSTHRPIATNVPVYTPRLVMNPDSTEEDW